MSTVTISNSPIHSPSTLTAVYGETGPNWARFHTGIDFVPYGSTPALPMLYSCVIGTIAQINLTPSASLGNNVVIRANDGTYWRYCHMTTGTIQVTNGQAVTTATIIGQMGSTGNVTGPHLHLEHSTTLAWDYDTFLNPATALGIPNERGTIILYDGTVPPEPPTPTERKKSKFPWVIYTRKIIDKRNNFM